MRQSSLLSLFLCAILVGWFAPNLTTAGSGLSDHGSDIELALGDDKANVGDPTPEGWLTNETILRRQSDGHFYADGIVEGRQFHFLVDTGASIVALTGDDADAMGLYWDETKLRPIGRGASGTVHGVPVRIEQLEVGGFAVRNVQAAIIPEGLGVSLLGQSFLRGLDNVEIRGDEMKLGG